MKTNWQVCVSLPAFYVGMTFANMVKGDMMKTGFILFISGLILFMAGILLSMQWEIAGTIMGISGGMMMGSAAYFYAANIRKD